MIMIVKVINKVQKEKYLMMFMMETKLGELEKKSYTLLKNGLNQSMERISSISSKFKGREYWRGMWKRGRQVTADVDSCKKPSAIDIDDEFRLSARDLTFTNHCFKLDEFDTSTSHIPSDSFA